MNGTKLRTYYQLIKPGIVRGNLITAAAAFLFALHHAHSNPASLKLFAATILGLALCIAAGCVFNNVIDRDIDARMERTKDRALVRKDISIEHALLFALFLSVIGFSTLYAFVNLYAVLVTLFGVLVYVCVYTPAKRLTVHSTIMGAFAGAAPPVVGYVGVSNHLDANAMLLFLILLCWQMPHFFAIALYRGGEYQNAGLPVMPVRVGRGKTQVLMAVYTVLFGAAVLIFGLVNNLSFLYVLAMGAVSMVWILLGCMGFKEKDSHRWARRMFLYSLIALLIFSALIAFV